MAATGDLPSLPAAVAVAAYRIALEAVNNVLRHAAANSCTIRLAFHDQALYAEVTNDGCGITQPPPAGVGLASMRERAAELGGACTITAPPPGGTGVSAHLPCQDQPTAAGSDQPANKESPAWRSPSAS
jgi:signal transduction histidine kinase